MSFVFEKYTTDDGVYLNSPIPEGSALELIRVLNPIWEGQFLNEYLSFLRRSDGIQIENVIFNDSETLLYNFKQDLEKVLLGSNGNMDAFVFNNDCCKYQVVNFCDCSDVNEEFETLDSLFEFILCEQGVEISA